jgi:GTPase Era involved in 16S rRNA processing
MLGETNVGKSTLINKLVGDKMILRVAAERETTCFWRLNFS